MEVHRVTLVERVDLSTWGDLDLNGPSVFSVRLNTHAWA